MAKNQKKHSKKRKKSSGPEEDAGDVEDTKPRGDSSRRNDSRDDKPAKKVNNGSSKDDDSVFSEESSGKEDSKEVNRLPPPSQAIQSDGRYRNKQRCLVLCSRGVTARYRHLLEDLRTLIPHHKKESKLDPGHGESIGRAINDIAQMRGCSTILFLECRKRQDAYMWIGRVSGGGEASTAPPGPSARFHVTNIHTMDELRMTGNCMKGSRPILTFDDNFQKVSHLKLLKELFVDVFGTPRGHPKSKPFVDRVMAFYYADNRIWVRHYQILEQEADNALEAHKAKKATGETTSTSLVEIGPRFVLNPIRIFRGSFGGQTLFQNEEFVSPNEIRAMEYRRKGRSYEQRKGAESERKERQAHLRLPEDPLDGIFS